jgi:5'-AMP-activated protein kinase catalytic alpha subunit
MSKFKIGNYRLGKLLGYGSFGVVRLGVNVITNHQVAIKILNKKKMKQLKVKEKTYKEIHLSKMFDHPNVVKLYEYFESKDDVYVVFEYVTNGELFEYISNIGQLCEAEALKYFRQLVFTLDYIHGLGVSHRDLKPENILLDSDRNIKLADFGLSNLMKDGRSLKTS